MKLPSFKKDFGWGYFGFFMASIEHIEAVSLLLFSIDRLHLLTTTNPKTATRITDRILEMDLRGLPGDFAVLMRELQEFVEQQEEVGLELLSVALFCLLTCSLVGRSLQLLKQN